MTATDLLDRAAELGVHLVQVADNLPLHELSDSGLDRFEDRMARLGIRVEVGMRGIAPDHLRTYLHLAQRLGSPILRAVIDTAAHRPPEDEIVDTLRALMPEFERDGVVLAIENHDRFTARTLVHILERIGSDHIGICLDTVNSFGALEGPDVVVDVLGPWVVNLHIKDFRISRATHMMGFTIEGCPAGQGRLKVRRLLERLGALGRDPNAIIELWTPPEETLAETIAKENAWAVESIAYLRQHIPG
jgi:sugar phosphate isomerase/epimerase